MRCKRCTCPSFRNSRIRRHHLLPLLFGFYPIRCLSCHRQTYAYSPLAFLQTRRLRLQR